MAVTPPRNKAWSSGAADDGCSDLSGSAKLDYGRTLEGSAHLVYGGAKIKVGFVQTSFIPTGPNTADVSFDWFFPDRTASIVEHSTVTPIVGPLVAFDSTIEVVSGGTGDWTWAGVSNVKGGIVRFDLEGTLCD